MLKCILMAGIFWGMSLSVSAYDVSFPSEGSFSGDSFLLADNYSAVSGGETTLIQGRYIGGGVVGTIVGAGIGHAIQGRWLRTGWIHTVLQVGGWMVMGFQAGRRTVAPEAGHLITVAVSSLVIAGSRIWEIVDVWVLPSDIKAVKRMSLSPLLLAYDRRPVFGLQATYRF